jgi:hypothetical protein
MLFSLKTRVGGSVESGLGRGDWSGGRVNGRRRVGRRSLGKSLDVLFWVWVFVSEFYVVLAT